jgi:hypothetical protein
VRLEEEDFRAAAVAPNMSKIGNTVALRLGAADQHIAGRRCIDWVGSVGDCPGHEPGFHKSGRLPCGTTTAWGLQPTPYIIRHANSDTLSFITTTIGQAAGLSINADRTRFQKFMPFEGPVKEAAE